MTSLAVASRRIAAVASRSRLTRYPGGRARRIRLAAVAAVLAATILGGATWLASEAPVSPYEVVACAAKPTLGANCDLHVER